MRCLACHAVAEDQVDLHPSKLFAVEGAKVILESDHWVVRRQLGIGERQHVRTQLLGVACWDHRNLMQQAVACLALGDALQMMLRFHMHSSQKLVNTDLYNVELIPLFIANQAHQFEPHSDRLSRRVFDEICWQSELHVIPKDDKGSAEELLHLMYDTWYKSGRRFLGGNFASKTDKELRELYPDMWHETDSLWSIYDGQR